MPKRLSRRVAQKIAIWYTDREAFHYYAEMEEKVEKRKRSRLRLWECPNCGQKLRAATDTLQVECRGTECAGFGFVYQLRTVRLDEPFAGAA
jgi:ABC-type ATPase with predicted acetyltransferase domain